MKRLVFLFMIIVSAVAAFSQGVPQTVNFSATVRNSGNIPLANTTLTVRVTFYEGGQNGTPVYCALHQTTTNENGFMSFMINRNVLACGCNGSSNVPFEEIPWQNGNYWMQVEYQTDIAGDFISLGFVEIASGFYAFTSNYAITAQKLPNFEVDIENPQDGDVLVYNGRTGKWEARHINFGDGGVQPPEIPAYIDLGLPSGTLWATCNLGAETPEGYGDYFAWGETTAKSVFDWSIYDYCNGTYNTLTKYCSMSQYGNNGFTDTLTVLEPSDDAATVNLGENWRMPTAEEFNELISNCTHQWTSINYTNGMYFIGPNGNKIFIPISDIRYDDSEYTPLFDEAYYWTSSLYTEDPRGAIYLYYYSDATCELRGVGRAYGMVIRPVYVPSQNGGGDTGEGGGGGDTGNDTITYPQGSFTDTRDGNTYATVTIGQQTWMAENLRYEGSIPLGYSSDDDTNPLRYYPNNSSSNVQLYGYLYNWPAIMNGAESSSTSPSGVQGICPDGWHVPSYGEWSRLNNTLGGTYGNAGSKLAGRADLWADGLLTSSGNFGETNFNALPAGDPYNEYSFGHYAFFWCTTMYDNEEIYCIWLSTSSPNMTYERFNLSNPFSLRCVRNN